MREGNKIGGLFEKLLTNQATSKEKEELFQLINYEKDKESVFAWLEEIWDKTDQKHLDVSSKSILDKIHHQIEAKEPKKYKSKKGNSKIRKIIRTSLKYAAVCVVACGVEWFILTQDNRSLTENTTPQLLHYNEITVPHGSKSYLVLADSTKVWLNAGAKFRYPSSFQKNSREVFLEGEAFFDVSKNKKRPFYVNMAGMNIKVLGTRFNVEAYADEKTIETTLVEGAIEVVGLKSDKEGKKNLCLKPGQKLILTKETSSDVTNPVKIKNAELINLQDTKSETAWTEDKLIFYKEGFNNVKLKLERWYGVKIDVQNPQILDYRFTGTFDEETFEQALLALKKVARFDYKIDKKQVIITRN